MDEQNYPTGIVKRFTKALSIIDYDYPMSIIIIPSNKEGSYSVVTDDPFDGVEQKFKEADELIKSYGVTQEDLNQLK